MPDKPIIITTPERTRVTTTVDLDGETLHAIMPKAGQMLAMTRAIEGLPDDLAEMKLIDSFLELCLDEPSRDRLRERLDDPEDDFDLDTLTDLMNQLKEVWADRPTGPSTASSQRPRRTGRASTARAPRSA
jgi:hypothetical protein